MCWHCVFAQTVDTIQLEEVVVTETKFPIKASNSIKNSIRIDRDEMQRSGSMDLAQLLNQYSGILVNGGLSPFGKDKGVSIQGASNAYSLLLIDGQPVIDPSALGGVLDIRNLSPSDIESIEIVKGSQSVLYGTEAIAGVINIRTKQPTEMFHMAASGTIGSQGATANSVHISSKKKNIDFSVGTNYFLTSGISQARPLAESFDRDGFRRFGSTVKLGYLISDRIKTRMGLVFSDVRGDFDAGAFMDAENSYNSRWIRPTFVLSYEDHQIQGELHYQYNDVDRSFDTDFGETDLAGSLHQIETFWKVPIANALSWISGLQYQNHRSFGDTDVNHYDLLNAYSSLRLLSNPWIAEAGGRITEHSTFGSKVTYSISAGYASDRFRLSGEWSTGFKAPSLFQIYSSFGGSTLLTPGNQ